MKSFLENFGSILGGVTVALLLMSVCHEYGYFLAVGQHFQTILTTTDYFGNAVLWLPFMVVTMYISIDWNVLLGRRIIKPFGINWGSLFWFALIVVWPVTALFLPFAGPAAWVWAIALLWMMYSDKLLPFEDAEDETLLLLRRAMVVLPVVSALLFDHGYSHGREDLRTFDSPYDIEIRSGGTIHRIMLRSLDKGLLVRDAANNRVEFLRWDDVVRLSRLARPMTTPLACRWLGWNCPESIDP
ncbi:hypothetical protein [Bradyrhizobium ganzhouense]|uniref:hypothetical protein n=1 Tax=Bradyrhizobium ganzhouense TaxID=1179767 RepID=UPI003CF3178D